MPFIRRKRGQVLVVHNKRTPKGKVRQEVLHRFASPSELDQVLLPEGWTTLCETLSWQNPDLRWPWDKLRDQLITEHQRWLEVPAGAAVRRERKVVQNASALRETLSSLIPARKADEAALARARPALLKLHEELERVLAGRQPLNAIQEKTMEMPETNRADQLFEEGMEHWWVGDRAAACRYYRRALKEDPGHADALNHLGITFMDRGRTKEAEQHFQRAITGGERRLVRDAGRIEWGWLENRPYLRALGNLALLYAKQGHYEKAVDLWERQLSLNPNDNQGVRWQIGEGYHRLGRLDEAIACYERALEEPGVCYDLALALHQAGQEEQVGPALLRGFAKNRYIPPMLLGESWAKLDGFSGTNMADPEWAADYVERVGDLWRSVPGSAELLRTWWHAEPVRAWRERIDEIELKLKGMPVGDERSHLVYEHEGCASESMLRMVAADVAPEASGRVKSWRKPYLASLDEVRIIRRGREAVIEYVDPAVPVCRVQLGAQIEEMSDEAILTCHNEILKARDAQRGREEDEFVAIEIPPGKPQIEYHLTSATWSTRGHVLRCLVLDDEEAKLQVQIDDRVLTREEFAKMLVTYAGWGMRITFVPDDEIEEQPLVVVREP